jgi:hypothetical protein
MKVIPNITRAKTAEVKVGEFVFLLGGGVEKPLALRSEDEPSAGAPKKQYVIRLDGPKIELLEAHVECLWLRGANLAWKLGADQIKATVGTPGAVVLLSEGPYLVIETVDRGPTVSAIVLSLNSGMCKTVVWGGSKPTLPWSIVDDEERVYAQWPLPAAVSAPPASAPA